MTQITNAERVLQLLRNQLERSARARDKGRTGDAAQRSTSAGPLERVQNIAALNGLPDEEVGRALIGGLLAEEFGPTVAASPRFQALVDEVFQALNADGASERLLNRALTQLRGVR